MQVKNSYTYHPINQRQKTLQPLLFKNGELIDPQTSSQELLFGNHPKNFLRRRSTLISLLVLWFLSAIGLGTQHSKINLPKSDSGQPTHFSVYNGKAYYEDSGYFQKSPFSRAAIYPMKPGERAFGLNNFINDQILPVFEYTYAVQDPVKFHNKVQEFPEQFHDPDYIRRGNGPSLPHVAILNDFNERFEPFIPQLEAILKEDAIEEGFPTDVKAKVIDLVHKNIKPGIDKDYGIDFQIVGYRSAA